MEKRVYSKAEAWIDILKNTQYEHEPQQRIIRGRAITQNYGEAILSTRYCGQCWGWHKTSVERFFKLLEKMEMLCQKCVHSVNILIVINFSTYDVRNGHIVDTIVDTSGTLAGHWCGQSKEGKEGKENIYTPDFLLFWGAYPKKVGKGGAARAWKRAVKNMPQVETIAAILERHKASQDWKKNNGQYIPNPETWINQRRWEDVISEQTADQKWKQAL